MGQRLSLICFKVWYRVFDNSFLESYLFRGSAGLFFHGREGDFSSRICCLVRGVFSQNTLLQPSLRSLSTSTNFQCQCT